MGTVAFLLLVLAVLAVAVEPLLLFRKLKRKTRSWLLGHAVALEVAVFVILLVLHKGTGWGMMVASASAVLVSIGFSALKKLDGYYTWQVIKMPKGRTRTIRVFVPGWLEKEEPK